jgi:hypothetical protein
MKTTKSLFPRVFLWKYKKLLWGVLYVLMASLKSCPNNHTKWECKVAWLEREVPILPSKPVTSFTWSYDCERRAGVWVGVLHATAGLLIKLINWKQVIPGGNTVSTTPTPARNLKGKFCNSYQTVHFLKENVAQINFRGKVSFLLLRSHELFSLNSCDMTRYDYLIIFKTK